MFQIVYLLMGAGLALYVVTAGADLGAGVWDLLARGDRQLDQRHFITKAIAPIWEANHVWLIFIIVLLFSAFPVAYSRISIGLHLPITIALVGVVLRGTAFTFRSYGLLPKLGRRIWGRVFGVGSVVTPLALGAALGAISSGALTAYDGSRSFNESFVAPWLGLFPIAVGLYALGLFALLAAVYLAAEAEDEGLRAIFVKRAFISEVVCFFLAGGVALSARTGAPALFEVVTGSSLQWLMQLVVAGCAVGTLLSLRSGHLMRARILVAAQVGGVVVAWGLAMDGHLVQPDLTLENAAGPVLGPLVPITLVGAAILAPALWYLFRIFKTRDDAPAQ